MTFHVELPQGCRHVMVTGPHRSGTTFAATVLAHELGFGLALEEKIDFANRYLVECHLRDEQSWVIQCPFLSDVIHEYGLEDVLIVWMKRDLHEILRSQNRMYGPQGFQIPWTDIERRERRKYHTTEQKPIAQIKQECWELQKGMIPHWRELSYQSLQAHPLYQRDRATFAHRQTAGEGIEPKPPRLAWNEGVLYV